MRTNDMVENKSPRRNLLNLVIGLGFLGYGSYRLFSFFTGTEYSNFRIVIAVGFVVLGLIDLFKYFKPKP